MHKMEFRSIQGRQGWWYVGGQHAIGSLYMLPSRCVEVEYLLVMKTCLPSAEDDILTNVGGKCRDEQ